MAKTLINLLLVVIFTAPSAVSAESPSIEISPLIIEEQAKIRDILDYNIKIKNNSKPYKVTLYPVVSDITDNDGRQEVLDFSLSSDKNSYLSRWMSFSRGLIGLMPGEETTLAVKININSNAKPGKYRAALMFSEAPNSYEAEALAKVSPQPQAIFNITVKDNIVEKAEISAFRSAHETFLRLPAKIILGIKNIGNKAIVPEGSIYIFNRRDQEVAKININEGGRAIEPELSGEFDQNWSLPDAFGRYKAKLEVEYGSGEKKTLQDTIYFWILPYKILIGFGLGLAGLIIILIVASYRRRQISNISVADNREIAKETEQEQAGILNLRRK